MYLSLLFHAIFSVLLNKYKAKSLLWVCITAGWNGKNKCMFVYSQSGDTGINGVITSRFTFNLSHFKSKLACFLSTSYKIELVLDKGSQMRIYAHQIDMWESLWYIFFFSIFFFFSRQGFPVYPWLSRNLLCFLL